MVEELADGVLPAASRNQASSLSLVEPVALEAFPPLRPTAGWRPRWRASMEGTVFRVEMCSGSGSHSSWRKSDPTLFVQLFLHRCYCSRFCCLDVLSNTSCAIYAVGAAAGVHCLRQQLLRQYFIYAT